LLADAVFPLLLVFFVCLLLPLSLLAQRIQFARTKSDAVAKLDGSYKPDKERSKKREAARGACGGPQQQKQQYQHARLAAGGRCC
jgi:hypothetical protein